MRFDEFLGLHEHAAGAAAGVVNLAVVRREDGDQRLDDAGRRVELATLLAFGAGELAEEVFINLAEHVTRLARFVAEADGGDQIDQLAELAIRQLRPGVAFVEDALEPGVFGLDQRQGVVDALADVRLFRGGAQGFPAGGFRHPEDVGFLVVVAVFQLVGNQGGIIEMVVVGGIGEAPGQFGTARGEGIGDILDEDQPEDEVFVLGGIQIGAQLVGGRPEGFLDVVEHGLQSRG